MQTVNLGNVKGPKGDIGQKGADGKGATVQVGTVATGENASVVNSGTSSDAIFDFVFPKNSYALPAATASALGGVKSGGGITVDASGNVTLSRDAVSQILTQLYPKGVASQVKLGSTTKQQAGGIVSFTASEMATTHSHTTSGTTNEISWIKYDDGTCILRGVVDGMTMVYNGNSAAYEKTINFPFIVTNPMPFVSTKYRLGQPKSSCMEVTNDKIIIGAEATADGVKINWFVIGSYS